MPKAKPQLTWVNCLHIYQPPWQSEDVIRLVTRESYEWIVAALKKFPQWNITMNIAGTLLDSFDALKMDGLLNDLKKLVQRGQIELTGSAHFHAFLPELPDHEITHQIALQEFALKKYFSGYKPAGFFAPELAYSNKVGAILRKRKYRWIVLDPISTTIEPKPAVAYTEKGTGLRVVFRDRTFSRSFPPEAIYKMLNARNQNAKTLISVTDGELYGHFHKDWQDHLEQVLRSDLLETQTVSQYLEGTSRIEEISIHPASWETRARQLRGNNPFSIWYNVSNPIHRDLWALAHFAIKLLEKNPNDPNHHWSRMHLDRGLASCSWWWASEVKTSAFAPLAWSPDEIEHGGLELIRSIRSIDQASTREKLYGEKLYTQLLEHVWTKHWKKHGKKK